MKQVVFALPILPGRVEAWIRFTQALVGPRRGEYAASRCHWKSQRECFWLMQAQHTPVALVTLEIAEPKRLYIGLARSQRPFDLWLKRQLWELHGLDLAHCEPIELVARWPEV